MQDEIARAEAFAKRVNDNRVPQPRPQAVTPAQYRADLAPGQKAVLERFDRRGVAVLCGRVPFDGSTRQQRRAMERAGISNQ